MAIEMVVPLVVSLLAYALIARAGLELLAIWVVLILISNWIGIADLGMHLALGRAISDESLPQHAVTQIWWALLGVSFALGVLPIALAYSFGQDLAATLALPAGPDYGVLLAGAVAAGLLNLGHRWCSGMFLGFNKLIIGQLTYGLPALLQVPILLGAVAIGRPTDGFVFAILAVSGGRFVGAVFAMRQLAGFSWRERPKISALHNLKSFILGGRGFAALNAGLLLRDVFVRTVLGTLGGAAELAIFDVATRIPKALRDLSMSGLRSILPAISALLARGLDDEISVILRAAFAAASVVTVPTLVLYYIYAPDLIHTWLGSATAETVQTTRVMTVWWIVHSWMVPWFWAVQAYHRERFLALLEFLGLAIVVVFSIWVVSDALSMAKLLLGSALLTQGLFCFYCQMRWGLFRLAFDAPRDAVAPVFSILAVGAAIFWAVEHPFIAMWISLALSALAGAAILVDPKVLSVVVSESAVQKLNWPWIRDRVAGK